MSVRYALYYVPKRDDPIYTLGSDWLGWDSHAGQKIERDENLHIDLITKKPAIYGFHATLKPPFHLKDGVRESDIIDKLDEFSRNLPTVDPIELDLKQIGSFLAFVPKDDQSNISLLAERCVKEFDLFRREMTEEEFDRRNNETLTANQVAHLSHWGYPYVMEEFRFHMTLTDKLEANQIEPTLQHLTQFFSGLLAITRRIDQIVLSKQPGPTESFRTLHVAELSI